MSEEKCILEKQLKNFPESISTGQLTIIIEQTKRSICKIHCKDGGIGTGFFCIIPFPDKINQLPVLITNNHVIKDEDIKENKTIIFSLDNEEIHLEVKVNDNRIIYTNEQYDITIIEIKDIDNLDYKSFLEIDDQIFKDNPDYNYRSKTVYLIHYPEGKESSYSTGLIKSIGIDNLTIRHLCYTKPGSSGCPIINLSNHRVIGVHRGAAEVGIDHNLGIFIKKPLLKFIKEYTNDKINSDSDKKKNELIPKENEETNEIIIVYDFKKIDDQKKLDNKFIERVKEELGESISIKKLFGEHFVEINNNICKLIIEGKN